MRRTCILALLTSVLFVYGGCKKDDSGNNGPQATVATASEQEPNDTTPQALGTLGTTDIVLSGSTSSENDVDRFSVILASTANLFVKDSTLVGANVTLSVQDANSINLTARVGASPQSCTLTSRSPGLHIIQVSSSNTSATSYFLRIGVR